MEFEINKNIILLHALLNNFDLAYNEYSSTNLIKESKEFFSEYKQPIPDEKEYIHPSKAVFWCLAVTDVPDFEPKDLVFDDRQQRKFDYGKNIKKYLADFYENTKFEKFYSNLLPWLTKKQAEFENTFKEMELKKVLESTWGTKIDSELTVILNPFTQASYGPNVGGEVYQVIGIGNERKPLDYSHNLIHEGSHPYAKEVESEYLDEINQVSYLLDKVKDNPNYPKSYMHWKTCFEEHLVRAVHRGLINPKIKEDYDLDKNLKYELEHNGMFFIYDFYDVLVEENSVANAIPKIIDLLEHKYSQ